MAVTLVSTVGGATANSFVSTTEADTFFEHSLRAFDDWGAEASDDKKRALIEATRDLSVLIWVGQRVNDTQALSWPRKYAVDPDVQPTTTIAESARYNIFLDAVLFDEDEIPQRVKNATIELAFEYLVNTRDMREHTLTPTTVLVESTIDVISKSYEVIGGTERKPARGILRFPRVIQLIWPLLDHSGTLRVARS